MTSAPEASATHPDCTAVVDEFALRMKGADIDTLKLALQSIQPRLGTTQEQPCDPERVQFLIHQINNRLTVIKLQLALRQLGYPPNPPAP